MHFIQNPTNRSRLLKTYLIYKNLSRAVIYNYCHSQLAVEWKPAAADSHHRPQSPTSPKSTTHTKKCYVERGTPLKYRELLSLFAQQRIATCSAAARSVCMWTAPHARTQSSRVVSVGLGSNRSRDAVGLVAGFMTHATCQEPGSAPEPYARQSSMSYLYLFILILYIAFTRGRTDHFIT